MGGKHEPTMPFRAVLSGRRGIASQDVEVIGKTRTHFHVKALAEAGLLGFVDVVTSTWVLRDLVDPRPVPKALPRQTRALGHQWNSVIKPFSKTLVWTCKHCPEVQTMEFGPGHEVDWFPAPRACPNSPRRVG